MKWPWRRGTNGDLVVVGSDADTLAWATADAGRRLQRCGVERRGDDTPQEFARRVRGLGLQSRRATAVLPLHEAQLLQVEAPVVKPEELKAAARWRIKDVVEGRLDDLTIDVMHVGDGRSAPHRQVFVAAARNALIRGLTERCQAMGLQLGVIDIAESAQRNLQTAVAVAEGVGERATAALMVHGTTALLTICAGGELFYARRLQWGGFDEVAPAAPPVQAPASLDELDFIDYGAANALPDTEGAPRLVIELQRSFDVWERQWPDLPLAGLWVQAGAESSTLAIHLEQALGMRVAVLDPARALAGFDGAATEPAVREALLPVIGGLLRVETRAL